MKGRLHHVLIGGGAMLALTLAVAVLSAWPVWRSMPEGAALLRLSFTHGAERNCRERTREELNALPPNMRLRKLCDRTRPPVYIELDLDGTQVFAAEIPPTGLAGTGPSRVYERFVVPAGSHDVAVRMRDRPATRGFDHEVRVRVILRPAQSYVIDFRPEAGGFVFK
jgi:hypothetical protein